MSFFFASLVIIIMTVKHHIASSVLISGLLYTLFKSWELTIASLFAGILIDVDHIIDYTREHGLPHTIEKFAAEFKNVKFSRLFLIFHGWEWLIFLFVIAKVTDWNPWISGLLIGCGQHMLLDQLGNRVQVMGYFLVWRWLHKFDVKAFIS